jgi:predicted dehydrogenase
VPVVADADDPRLKHFTDTYDLAPVATEELLADERITAVMVHSKSKDMVPLALRVLDAGKGVVIEKPGG